METEKIVRYIGVYDKKTEYQISEIHLPENINLSELKSLFKVDDSDPEMIYVYDVLEGHVKYLENLTGKKLDIHKYDYQIVCYSNN